MEQVLKREDPLLYRSELELLKVLQSKGRLSLEELGRLAGMPPSTVQYALHRLEGRRVFDYRAVPRLESFQELLPSALLVFKGLVPQEARSMAKEVAEGRRMAFVAHSEQDLVVLARAPTPTALEALTDELVKRARAPPVVLTHHPHVLALNPLIDPQILDSLFPSLPDRRVKF